ncbi:transposase [Methylobacterium sp. WL119]|nr:transposase [Methylobacterium sp. WL119]
MVVAPLLPAPATTGWPWRWPLRSVLDCILYVLRTGNAVHHWFSRLLQARVFERLGHALTLADCE